MTVLAMHCLASLELEDDEFVAKILGNDLSRDLSAVDEGLAELERRIADGQDFAKHDLGIGLTG